MKYYRQEVLYMAEQEELKDQQELTTDDISRYAMQNETLPDNHTMADELLWYRLRDIYKAFRNGTVNAEDGKQQKGAALYRHELESSELKSVKKICMWHSDFWKRIEFASAQYKANPSLETAEAFYREVYSVARN